MSRNFLKWNSRKGSRSCKKIAPSSDGATWRRSESTLSLERASRASRYQTVPEPAYFRLLLRLGWLRPVGPASAEQVSLMLIGHGAEQDHAHNEEDQEEDDGNDENWHTSPLRPFWNATARQAVTTITARCEAQTQARRRQCPTQIARQTARKRCHLPCGEAPGVLSHSCA